MLSPAQQNVLNHQLWPQAARAQGWPGSEAAARAQGHGSVRAFRLKVLSQIVGHPLESSSEIGSIEEFTKVKDELLTLAGVLGGHRGAAALPQDNALRTRRWVALRDIQCLLLYVDEAYVREILRQRFHRADVDWTVFDRLPLQRIIAAFDDVEQLNQLLSTLNERLHAKGGKRRACGFRVQRGHTVHQMRQLAGVKCDAGCRECHPRQVITLAPISAPPSPISHLRSPVPA